MAFLLLKPRTRALTINETVPHTYVGTWARGIMFTWWLVLRGGTAEVKHRFLIFPAKSLLIHRLGFNGGGAPLKD